MSGWSLLFWLIITVLLLYPLNRWINAHVQGVAFLLTGSRTVALWFFWVLFLPGTFLHEVSHWLTAKLLGVKTTRFSLWPQPKKGGQLQMGAVQIEVPDPFRHSLIGLAPLIFGSLAVLLIGQGWLGLDRIGAAVVTGDMDITWRAVAETLTLPDVWIWLYLIFAISNAMLPSASDREAWRTVLLYLAIALILAIGLGLNPGISPQLQEIGISILALLLTAFIITIAVDLFFMLIIFTVETLLAWLSGRQIQYNR